MLIWCVLHRHCVCVWLWVWPYAWMFVQVYESLHQGNAVQVMLETISQCDCVPGKVALCLLVLLFVASYLRLHLGSNDWSCRSGTPMQ